jgi:hypothetical protein
MSGSRLSRQGAGCAPPWPVSRLMILHP